MNVVTPPPARRKSVNEVGAENLIPKNREEAVKRLEKYRKTKRPRKQSIQHYVRLTKAVSDVLRIIEEQYDTPLNQILKRFVEDGIKKYTPELSAQAGLTTKPNPFEQNSFAAPVPQAFVPRVVAPTPISDPIYSADSPPLPSGGPPIPTGEV